MIEQFKKTVIRMSFEAVVDQLEKELNKEGFEPVGVTNFQQPAKNDIGRAVKRYQVLAVYFSFFYNEMMRRSSFEGAVVPSFILVIEKYPGEVALVRLHSTQVIAREIQNPSLQNLTAEIARRLAVVIHALEKEQTGMPDIVTSWE